MAWNPNDSHDVRAYLKHFKYSLVDCESLLRSRRVFYVVCPLVEGQNE